MDAAALALRASSHARVITPEHVSAAAAAAGGGEGGGLRGKVVLVTGAASGFGRSFALECALTHHVRVVIAADINATRLDELEREIDAAAAVARQDDRAKCEKVVCDVTSWDSQLALFEHAKDKYGTIDVVVASAGVTERPGFNESKLLDGRLEEPDLLTVKTNLLGSMYTAKLAFHFFKLHSDDDATRRRSRGSLVLLGSMSSYFGLPLAPVYSASKHGILGLFNSLSTDAQVYDIALSIVTPWFTDTNILDPGARLLISGLPRCKLDVVVAALVYCASAPPRPSDEKQAQPIGRRVVVDAQGILELGEEQLPWGERNYYLDVAKRGFYLLSIKRFVEDYAALGAIALKPLRGASSRPRLVLLVTALGAALLAATSYASRST